MTTEGLRKEQLVIAQIRPTPTETADKWTVLPKDVLELDWAEILLLAVQHRIEGILEEALKIADCADQVPPSVLSLLRRRADLAEARYVACYDALVELNSIAPSVVAGLVFFKGATIAPLYNAPHHRMLGDFDFIVQSHAFSGLRAAFDQLGYWEKPGRNGPTYFGDAKNPRSGCEYVAFDVHLDAPPKYNRTDSSVHELWRSRTEPHVLGEVDCRKLDNHLELLELLVHLSEHTGSWIHVCLDDDIRLIRILDIELICSGGDINGAQVRELAAEFGLEGELALGLGQLLAVRGELPAVLRDLHWLAEAAAELVDAIALPDGRIETWRTPIGQRAFDTRRSTQALSMMPPESRHRNHWFDWRQGVKVGRENVGEIARQLSESLNLACPPTRHR
jgi:putative nucleotidyltransferase-like protein